jgi:hypothetical protein
MPLGRGTSRRNLNADEIKSVDAELEEDTEL